MDDKRETILRRTQDLEKISKEDYDKLYRTKDMYLAAFLVSKGFDWKYLEEVEITKKVSGQYPSIKKFIFFLFESKMIIEKFATDYYNTNRNNSNCNANNLVQSILNVRSITTNPPF